ncbi:MAG: Na+/H+ antiporter subunit C [Bacteroidetes bacterium]|nr:Na+/H+ antiporter subunit C [Bacteroidota bacterium]
MELVFALVIGGLYAAGIYMILRRSIVKLIIGLALLSQAANLLIFAVGRPGRGTPPIVAKDATTLLPPFSDPLPQALILTAIVISFAVTAFALILIKRAYQEVGTDDLDAMRTTDQRQHAGTP